MSEPEIETWMLVVGMIVALVIGIGLSILFYIDEGGRHADVLKCAFFGGLCGAVAGFVWPLTILAVVVGAIAAGLIYGYRWISARDLDLRE